MAFADRVRETTTTTGTGNITLGGAVAGFQSFSSAFDLNDDIEYAIEAVDTNGIPTGDWEVGDGYLSGASTFIRDQVRASSNAGALVSFSAGNKFIFNTMPGHRARQFGRAWNFAMGLP